MKKEQRFAVIRYLVDELEDVGKTKMQKIVYFLQNAFGVPLDYVFGMHYFGPYSEKLDDDLVDMKLRGYVDIEPDPGGYGYHIHAGSEAVESMRNMTEEYLQQLSKTIDTFRSYSARDLELLGTLHFARQVAEQASTSDIIDKVARLKPRFEKSEIEQRYRVMEELLKGS